MIFFLKNIKKLKKFFRKIKINIFNIFFYIFFRKMFEIKKSGYVIQSNNHELPESVLKLFPESVYSIILPQTRYFTCKYYKYMTDPFTEQYMYNQVINGNILAWGLRTIATDPSGNNITQKKKTVHWGLF